MVDLGIDIVKEIAHITICGHAVILVNQVLYRVAEYIGISSACRDQEGGAVLYDGTLQHDF